MVLNVKVIPGARKNLYKEENGTVKIYLTAPPVEGRANEALCDFLAEHFDVRVSCIGIIKGLKSRNKVINIKGI
ncbi:MAG: DUF167 domain-containing protein [Candidatus Omnitrophica bacterium]|nr:DUF167 domain-containing protein [Candidatus Omnitrophota bacterium]